MITSKLKLLNFQQEDFEQLKSMRSRLIGNDQGTGKTYEGIAIDQANRAGDGNAKVDLRELFPRGKMKTLVVCPKTVIGSWEEHCEELTDEDVHVVPDLQPMSSYKKRRAAFVKKIMSPHSEGYFIVNWEFLRLELDSLKKVYFLNIIADECQRAKNRKAQQTRALKQLRTVYKTAMSGTPADNNPEDIWSIFNWLWPNYYTSFWKFVKAYCLYEDVVDPRTGESKGYKKFKGVNPETIGNLHKEMKPWFVRHLKEDVLPDLPAKYYSRIWVDLDPKQRKAYDQMRKTMVAWVEEHENELDNPVIANAVVSQLVRLQQYANAYLVPQLDEDGNHKFKIVRKTNKKTGELEEKTVYLYDAIDPSSKLDAVMEWLEDHPDEQVIIFSKFKTIVNLLSARLEAKAIPHGLLTGDVKQTDRTRFVQEFQAGRLRVFAGTIAAGGVGITLTAARTVIFIDREWSPAWNTQAEDRAHRIGQENAVEIIDLMARNTVDLGKAQRILQKGVWLKQLLGDKVPQVQLALEAEQNGTFEPEQTTGEEEANGLVRIRGRHSSSDHETC
jgi:SNF2 family DNA or RNA helicase